MSAKRKHETSAATTTSDSTHDGADNTHAAKKKQAASSSSTTTAAHHGTTVDEILTHRLSLLAKTTWPDSASTFDAALVRRIYNEDLLEADATLNGDFAASGEPEGANGRALGSSSTSILELSHYLENFLWPHFSAKKDATHSVEHVLSIIIMINEKSKENLVGCFGTFRVYPIFRVFFFFCSGGPFVLPHLQLTIGSVSDFLSTDDEEKFAAFVQTVVSLEKESNAHRKRSLSWNERTLCVAFLINCYQSLENAIVRKTSLKLVSLPIWSVVGESRRDAEFKVFVSPVQFLDCAPNKIAVDCVLN